MKMKQNKKKGFTLVELLAVIVILAIILVIAVPKVMSVIEDSKKATLESTAKMIASSAEKAKVQNTVLGNTGTITCDSVAKINDLDYEDCDIDFDENTAKVTIKGSGKFNGLWVCNGTKTNATAINESCGLRTLTVNLDGGTVSENQNGKYEAGSEVILIAPTKEGYTFNGWTVTGAGASVDGNKLTMGSEATTITALWEEEQAVATVVDFSTDSWETIVAAVKQAETNGTEYPYNVGDEKTIDLGTTLGTHTIRVANKTKCSAVSVTSKTACGFVLEFKDVITTHAMNGNDSSSATNAGGWPASEMRSYLNDLDANSDDDGVIYNALPEALKDEIIDTYVVSGVGSRGTTGYANIVNGNFYSTDKLYLLSTYEVWGSNPEGHDTAATSAITRQLDYYVNYKGVDSSGNEYTGVSTTNYGGAVKYNRSTASNWWLRSSYSNGASFFYYVGKSGDWYGCGSYYSIGVAPAFRLAN